MSLPFETEEISVVVLPISNKIMDSKELWKTRRAEKVFRCSNRDGSHIEIVVSPSSQTGGGFCIVSSSADGIKPPHT